MEEKGVLFSEFSVLLFDAYARWKGTGEPWPNCSLKIVKNFPRHFWKILCFLISLYSPLSHGIWILVQHPSIQTLAFLEHSEWGNPNNYSQLNDINGQTVNQQNRCHINVLRIRLNWKSNSIRIHKMFISASHQRSMN